MGSPVTTEQSVKESIQGALDSLQRAAISSFDPTSGPITIAAGEQLTAQADATLAAHFVDPALTRYTKTLAAAIGDEARGTERDFDGGVRSLELTGLAVNGDQARVTATGTAWFSALEFDGPTTTTISPATANAYTFQLVRSSGTWKISDMTISPLPGSEP